MNSSKWRILIFFMAMLQLPFIGNAQSEIDTVSVVPYDSIHKPKTAVILAAIIPSAGHIYNHIKRLPHHKSHLWWKLPIIYGGMGFSGYMIVNNHQQYKAFKQERINRLDVNYNPVNGDYALYADFQLLQIQEQYRKWRDLSVIGALGFYLLQIIDANVEAHLMHFDISDDMSLHISPILTAPTPFQFQSFGASVRLNF
jgi:hypothetical protein